jgi:hypothetical protein
MANKRVRPLRQFPLDPDLIAGLKKLSEQLHEPGAAIVSRAIRRELEREGVMPVRKRVLRTSSQAGWVALDGPDEVAAFLKENRGAEIRTADVTIIGKRKPRGRS